MKKLFENWKRHLNEEIYGNRAIVYHGTNSLRDVEAILTKGYSLEKNTAAMYGKGIYTVYELEGTNTGKGDYGPMVIKFAINMSGKHLILDYDEAKKVHGDDYRLKDQLKKMGINTKVRITAPEIGGVWAYGSSEDLRNKNIEGLSAVGYKIEDVFLNSDGEVMVKYYKIALRDFRSYRAPGGINFKKGEVVENSESLKFQTFKEATKDWAPINDKGISKQEIEAPVQWEKLESILEKRQGGRTSVVAQKIHNMLSTSKNRMDHYLDSITFTGANDGPVMVIYNPEKAKMLSWKEIRIPNRPSVGDIVKFDPMWANGKGQELQRALNEDVDFFYQLLKDIGIRRDSEILLKMIDEEPYSETGKVFKKYIKSLKGEIIGRENSTGLMKVKWEGEDVGRIEHRMLSIIQMKDTSSQWVKDVNGKKILNYIQRLKKEKRPNLP